MLDVVYLLTEIVFNDDFICNSCLLDRFDSFKDIVTDIEFASASVKAVACDSYYKVVSQGFSSVQKVNMALMQKVICSICDYFLHLVLVEL